MGPLPAGDFIALQAALAGRYSLERELGRGGMGVVYLAHEVRLDRLVAIKVLPPEMAAQPSLRERFLREARTAARLSHPNIVPIFAVDEVGGFVFYAMAFVDGETLGQRLNSRGPLASAEATRVLREVAWALGHAHAQGVVHRDVKPANILLERQSGRALVADFGIARQAKLDGGTTEGERLGTPEYMSPEQASGDPLDGRSDIYSLGVVGFVALSGRLPFTGDTAQSMLAQHITKPAPPVASVSKGVSRAVAEAVDRCLLKEPGARFADASALADALGDAMEKRVEIPVPVRLFIGRGRNIAPLVLSASCLVPLLIWLIPDVDQYRAAWYAMLLGTVGTLAIPIPLVDLLLRLRKLCENGYGPDDLVAALRETFRRRREEYEFEFGTRLRRFEIGLWSLASVGAFWMVMALGVAIRDGALAGNAAELFNVSSFATAFMALSAWLQRRSRLASESFWARFWDGRFGRFLARVAGTGVVARSVSVDRPTEIAIAMSAQALFAELPKETRQAMGEFPAVMQMLETRAGALRERLAEIDASVVEASRLAKPSTAEARQSIVTEVAVLRGSAQERLSSIVVALETLRLDLLRLKVGAITVDGVTADLAAARELGAETERQLEARREVERAVRSISPRPI